MLNTAYRAGKDGARLVFRDGSAVQLAPFAVVVCHRHPLKVEGRLYPVEAVGVGYEVQPGLPRETK